MTLRLVDSGWGHELTDALRNDSSELQIICPFIKVDALERLLVHRPKRLQVITRFNLADFADGVSDIAALRGVLEAGRARPEPGIRNRFAGAHELRDPPRIL